MRRVGIVVALGLIAAGCGDDGGAVTSLATSPTTTTTAVDGARPDAAPPVSGLLAQVEVVHVGVTGQRLDGNRYVEGAGAVAAVEPIRHDLGGEGLWVVGVPAGDGVVWVVALEDGRLAGLGAGVDSAPGSLPPGMPPLVVGDGSEVTVVAPPPDASPFTHPVPLPDGNLVYVAADGSVRGSDAAADLVALPDARILLDGDAALLLVEPTTRYPHGVLGDEIEAGGFAVIDDQEVRTGTVEEGRVVEGIAPIWADLDGDGSREVIVTLGDAAAGARYAAYRSADSVWFSDPIGRGRRWRHQIAVAPLGPGGETELVGVRTPHIGGIVEFLRADGGRLEVVAGLEGYSSHLLGSRNLDMALAADADGDGQVEVVVPTQDLEHLAGVRRVEGGAEEAWRVPLGSRLASNLAAVADAGGGLHLAAATADGVLLVWSPPPASG